MRYLILLLIPSLSYAEEYKDIYPLYIHDGDTVKVALPQKEGCPKIESIRIQGIDAPERSQAYGRSARTFAAKFLYGRKVRVKILSKDRFGRIVGDLCRGISPYLCLSYQMVRNGFAWHYKKYSTDKRLARAEVKARIEKKGLWKSSNPIPPWEYRKR